ncbi:SDR family NAD(P)-dependent oxidoreductase [Streptomyces sp. NBC_01336]|uniref:SDR family NAD(P)-dependent oxidoreductase n=1 Tax=Streptomyces sp. NBC_01336 TaxID=2903829 RepID=UPI002E161C95|nr:SDR family NAD(P)-dependent oxidoreductase [Streptomyces sp. NBC_01336]
MNRFAGRTVLITGGTSGMGPATAHRLVAEGAHVIITGRTRARLDAAVGELGPGASGIVADAADLGAVDALMETVRNRHGRLDGLFANAGTGTFLPFEDITETDIDHAVDVNFKGVFSTVQKALPLLADGSSIVINASWTLHRGNSVLTLYSATKAAVHQAGPGGPGPFGRVVAVQGDG